MAILYFPTRYFPTRYFPIHFYMPYFQFGGAGCFAVHSCNENQRRWTRGLADGSVSDVVGP